jgi:hypothetical protein
MQREMILKVVFLSIFLCHAFHVTDAVAVEEVEASARYLLGDNDSKLDGRRLALLEAKRTAIEKAGSYVDSLTEVKDSQLTLDTIRAYTAAILEVTEIKENWETVGQSLSFDLP